MQVLVERGQLGGRGGLDVPAGGVEVRTGAVAVVGVERAEDGRQVHHRPGRVAHGLIGVDRREEPGGGRSTYDGSSRSRR